MVQFAEDRNANIFQGKKRNGKGLYCKNMHPVYFDTYKKTEIIDR